MIGIMQLVVMRIGPLKDSNSSFWRHPRSPVIPGEMAVLFECRIIVGRKHLAVGIDIHSGPFGLLEKFLHILEVMPADQDPRIAPDPDIHLGDLGMAIGARIGLIEEAMVFTAVSPHFMTSPTISTTRKVPRGRGQRLHHKPVDVILFKSQDGRMIGIRSHAFQPDDEEFPKGSEHLRFGWKGCRRSLPFP